MNVKEKRHTHDRIDGCCEISLSDLINQGQVNVELFSNWPRFKKIHHYGMLIKALESYARSFVQTLVSQDANYSTELQKLSPGDKTSADLLDNLTAIGYATHHREWSRTLTTVQKVSLIERVRTELLSDKYNGRASAFSVIFDLQKGNFSALFRNKNPIAAGLRMVRGADAGMSDFSNSLAPLEFMELLEPSGDWREILPHLNCGGANTDAAELTRFAIPADFRSEIFPLQHLMTALAFDSAARRCKELGILHLYAIMPPAVILLLNNIPHEAIEQASIHQQPADCVKDLYETYPGYWKSNISHARSLPKLYYFNLANYWQNRDEILKKAANRSMSDVEERKKKIEDELINSI